MAIRRKNIAGLRSDAISPCVPRFPGTNDTGPKVGTVQRNDFFASRNLGFANRER